MGGVLSAEDLRDCQATHLPAERSRLARSHVATDRRVDRGAHAEARAGADGRRAVSAAAARRRRWYVALARAMKAAYAERLAGLGEAEPDAAESCTTHLTVCDAEGTMVAMTTTLLSSMGSRVVLPNRACC